MTTTSASSLFLVLLILSNSEELEVQRLCSLTNSDVTKFSVREDVQSIDSQSAKTEVCKRGTHTCYALWQKVKHPDNSTSLVAIAQGCWEPSGHGECPTDGCSEPKTAIKDTVFCCCAGDFCNMNLTYTLSDDNDVMSSHDGDPNNNVQQPQPTHSSTVGGVGQQGRLRLLALISCTLLVFVLIIIFVAVLRKWTTIPTKHKSSPPNHNNPTSLNNPQSTYSMAHLKLEKIVGQGRYGTVWLGSVKDQQVAVKMFPVHYSQYYFNEKDIYTLPFMDHPSLLTYYGCDKTTTKEGVASYVLVLSYCPSGTLQDYLKMNTLDLPTYCRMALSTSAGLAHLHTEMRSGDKWKPCVTHRDVNTKNILVKSDLSCCLCDLGLGVKITGSHYYTLDEEQHAETKSINDVGTLRYMAPEVLEGAVNLRDCEASLKQIDVYALGLVLWEMAIRTSDFYNKSSDIPAYTLPFEKEVGIHPSLEQMQTAICRNKARPLFSSEWKHSSSAGRLVRETVDDCTDQDGEARLTALCVHERLSQLYKGCVNSFNTSGVSPTVNQTQMFPTLPLHNNNNTFSTNFTNNNTENSEQTGDKDGGASEGTVETILTMSPSEPLPHATLHSLHTGDEQQLHEYCLLTIQPHQGRNPCLERNLLSATTGASGGGGGLGGSGGSEEALLSIVHTSNKHTNQQPLGVVPPHTIRWEQQHHNPIPYVQNRPFTVTKRCNNNNNNNNNTSNYNNNKSNYCTETNSGGGGSTSCSSSGGSKKPITSLLKKPLRKLLVGGNKKNKSKKNAAEPENGRLIVSPFQEREDRKKKRPSSLQLRSVVPPQEDEQLSVVQCKPMKEISARVKTPGDLPPSVRKKRARLSLYDDRMMSAGHCDEASPLASTNHSAQFDSSF